MTGLLDTEPLICNVQVRGKDVVTTGLSADDIAYLMFGFPEVKGLMQNRVADLSPEKIVELGAKVVGAIISCATGTRGNKQAEAKAAKLSFPKQLEFINRIFEMTFEDGVIPFVEEMQKITGTLEEADKQMRSKGMNLEQATSSRAKPSGALDMDMGPRRAPLRRAS